MNKIFDWSKQIVSYFNFVVFSVPWHRNCAVLMYNWPPLLNQFHERKLIDLPIFKSFFPDCKFITSTAHLAAMTCCNASVFNWPWLHLLVSTCLLDSSWPGCCLCKLTRTPEKQKKMWLKVLFQCILKFSQHRVETAEYNVAQIFR